ncbi:MAG: hypothetical protein WC955_01020 [Elusimicrobiota bacterium]
MNSNYYRFTVFCTVFMVLSPLIFLPPVLNSEVPSGINYQGRYKEAGAYISGVRVFRFKITNSGGGTVYYDSGEVSLEVESGLFRYVLYCGPSVDWWDAAIEPYIEVYVGVSAADVQLYTRERILSRAYAFYATSATYANTTGDGNSPYLVRWSAANTVGQSTVISDNGTNIGISSTTPDAKLEINGSARLGSYAVFFGTADAQYKIDQGGALELGPSTATYAIPYIDFHYGTGSSQDYNIRMINDRNGALSIYSALSTGPTVYFSGNIQLGDTAPGDKVDLGSNYARFYDAYRVFYNRVTSGASGIHIYATTDLATYGPLRAGVVYSGLGLYSGDSTAYNLHLVGGAGYGTLLQGGNINPATSIGIYVNSSQNVGIGTSAPAYKLDVNGAAEVTTFFEGAGNITSSAHVKGKWSAFRAYKTGSQLNLVTGGGGAVVCDYAESFDVNGDFDPTTDTYVAPVAGYYFFAAFQQFAEVVDEKPYGLKLTAGGVDVARNYSYSAEATGVTCRLATIVHLDSGDGVQVKAWQESGVNTVDLYSSAMDGGFSGFLIRAD